MRWIAAAATVAFALYATGAARADSWYIPEPAGPGWHGSGWLGSARAGNWRRDPIVGVYGATALDYDPYASYRNDNGCYRVLPVITPAGVRPMRTFVCDY